MMDSVSVVNRELGTVDAVRLQLDQVEWRSDGIVLQVRAVEDDTTAALQDEFLRHIEQWSKQRESNPDSPPPGMPFTQLLAKIDVTVEDQIGTTYRPIGVTSAGSGTEWLASYVFEPAAPSGREIRIEISNGTAESITLTSSMH